MYALGTINSCAENVN